MSFSWTKCPSPQLIFLCPSVVWLPIPEFTILTVQQQACRAVKSPQGQSPACCPGRVTEWWSCWTSVSSYSDVLYSISGSVDLYTVDTRQQIHVFSWSRPPCCTSCHLGSCWRDSLPSGRRMVNQSDWLYGLTVIILPKCWPVFLWASYTLNRN